jgi:hypothetical protein|nr:MAG TPA: MutS domain I [Caudoviricetes sp.]
MNNTFNPDAFKTWKNLKAKEPNKVVFVNTDDFVSCYQEDAESVAKFLETAPFEVDDENLGHIKYLIIPNSIFEGMIPNLIRNGHRIIATDINAVDSEDNVEKNDEPKEMLERTFYVNCSKDMLIKLGDWMYDNGIQFEKLAEEKLAAEKGISISKTDACSIVKYLDYSKDTYKLNSDNDSKNKARMARLLSTKLTNKIDKIK